MIPARPSRRIKPPRIRVLGSSGSGGGGAREESPVSPSASVVGVAQCHPGRPRQRVGHGRDAAHRRRHGPAKHQPVAGRAQLLVGRAAASGARAGAGAGARGRAGAGARARARAGTRAGAAAQPSWTRAGARAGGADSRVRDAALAGRLVRRRCRPPATRCRRDGLHHRLRVLLLRRNSDPTDI